jgi:hypothetical protein
MYCLSVFGGPSQRPSFGSRLVYGGGVGLQFGDITLIQVAPNIGYKITDEWVSGIGLRYIYLEDRRFNYKTDIYGGSVYSQYYFLEQFLAHAEIEVLNLDAYHEVERRLQRTNVTSVLVGGGLKMHAGGNTYFTILGLWNLNETPLSPYTNPIIRVGLAIGL